MTDKTGHKDVYVALLAAQPHFKKPKKSGDNTHFKQKYSTLEDIVDAVKEALNAEGIAYFFRMDTSEMGESMTTVLWHSDSGTSLEFPVPLIIPKRDMQGLKSAKTYAKRSGLEDATGVASGDDDDAEDNRQGSDMGAALKDAWKQGVLDNLPEGATPAEKANAFAEAICADFQGKGEKALQNRWSKHKQMIGEMEARFPALHSKIIDAYENEVLKATNNYEKSGHGVE